MQSVSHRHISLDNCICCHTEIEVADKHPHPSTHTWHKTNHSQHWPYKCPTSARAATRLPVFNSLLVWLNQVVIPGSSALQAVMLSQKHHFLLMVSCLTLQQHASVFQGRISSDKCMCCHTKTKVADQTSCLIQSQYTDSRPTSPIIDLTVPGAWQ